MPRNTSFRLIKHLTAAVLSLPFFGASLLDAASVPEAIKTSIQRRVDYAYNPGIVIGIVDPNGRAFYSYGSTSIVGGTLPNENTLYEIGSISKVFTATLLAQMVENGDVELSDPVASFLPQEVNVPSRSQSPITLEHLATHASGLPSTPPAIVENNPINPFFPFPATALYEFLDSYELTRPPGDAFEYSNLGVGLLGHALSLHLGTPYESAFQERVLLPMGMTDTVLIPSAELNARRAQGYNGVVARPEFKMDSLEAAGSWLSTANDMLTFLEHQLGFQDSEVSSVLEDTQQAHFPTGSPGQDIGLGWFIIKIGSDTIRMHDGATIGHNSFAGINTRAKKGVIVFSNARLNQYAAIQDLGLHALVPSVPLNPIRRPVSLTDQERARLAGRYQEESADSFVTIGEQHSQLTVTSSLNPDVSFTLYPLRSTRFQLYEATTTATAKFSIGEDDQATSMQWTQDGESIIYSKVVIPATLTLVTSGDGPTLKVDGDKMTSYSIESSNDLQLWSPYQNLTGGSSFLITADQLKSHQYFRIK
ncbi:beta-lactamase family protein [Verrucomicrobia bacterium]|jgi:serine-type D-Ala-D-Ala carboxypeptidase/endopeptidase|nr:beta-lactamase family protein [Verrucomicrobiota bacterium]MDA7657366.1 beta-lactamase family protein [Verrucomicrobiota bacterium]